MDVERFPWRQELEGPGKWRYSPFGRSYRWKNGTTTAMSRPKGIGATRTIAMATASRWKVNCIRYEGRCPGSERRWTSSGDCGPPRYCFSAPPMDGDGSGPESRRLCICG